MTYTNRLRSTLIADAVKDHLDDLRVAGAITSPQVDKASSFQRLLRAINIADMDCCRIVKQQAQMVIWLPQGQQEVLLESAPWFINPLHREEGVDQVLGDQDNEAVAVTNAVFLNREWFVDASQIRSEYIYTYERFPTGNTPHGRKLKIVSFDGFENARMDGYNDFAHGAMPVVYYEPSSKRLRFATDFGKSTYISFPAYLMPSLVDFSRDEMSDCNFEDYIIKSPDYAEQFLVFSVLQNVLPISSEALGVISATLEREQVKLYAHMPQNTGAIEVTDGYIG